MAATSEATGLATARDHAAVAADDEGHPARRGIPIAEVAAEVEAKLANGEYQPGDRFPILVEGRVVMVTMRGPADCC